MDVQHMALLLEFFNFHGDLVRQFRTQLAHDLLAHQFGGQEAAAAVGDLVFGEEVLVLGQVLGDLCFQRLQVVPLLRGNRHHFGVR
ncbi:hypothetical protein D3C75_875750 [compost metagenome]